MDRKLINIIIPNYNNEKYISHCLDSALCQKNIRVRIIVIDDGSTDGSMEIIMGYKEKYGITIMSQEHQNAAVARNRGINEVTEGYILFLDSDDYLEEDALWNMFSTIERDSSDLVIGEYIDFYDDGTAVLFPVDTGLITDEREILALANQSPVPTNKLYSYNLINKYGIRFDDVRIGQDCNFYLKYLLHCSSVSLCKRVIYRHRILETSMTRQISFNIIDVCKSFEGVEKYYESQECIGAYNKYISGIAYKNIFWQMMKYRWFPSKGERKQIIDFFCSRLRKMNKKYDLVIKERYFFFIVCSFKAVLISCIGCKLVSVLIDGYEYGKRRKNSVAELFGETS